MTSYIFREPKSMKGAQRQYDALIREYHRRFSGGGAFGFDWTTFNANWPEGCAQARRLLTASQPASGELPNG